MQVQVTRVNNPFNRQDKDFLTIDQEGWDFITTTLKKLPPEDYALYINGQPCPITHKICDRDQITIIPRVAGGDNTKQILGAVAMIALMYFGIPASIAGTFAMKGTMAYTMIYMSVVLGAGMLIGSLMPAAKLDMGLNSLELEQKYSWNPQNTQQQGLTIPRYYGVNKIYGNVISVHTETSAGDDTEEILKTLVCLGMGPVKGILDDRTYINDQLYTAYENVSVEERRGLITQTYISFFDETRSEYRISILVVNGTPKTYLTPDTDFTDLEVVVMFDHGIFHANASGGLDNHTVGLKIELRPDGGAWSTLMETTVSDNVTSPIYKTYRASETYTGGSAVTITCGTKYEIRITKTTADQSSVQYGDSVKLFAIREILDDQFTYPRKALLGVEALATNQLSGGITLSCVQEGLIVNVYTAGAWVLEYSNNPAWVLWDILTQPVISGDGDGTAYSIVRYEGLDPARLDFIKFYELAQYCDDLVSDGEGGTEKRITFNGGFEASTTMWEAALTVCQVGRCILVWEGMNLTLAINKAGSVVQCFSDGNISHGTFKETFLPIEDRVSEIEVSYLDATQDFGQTVFSIYDPESDLYYNKITLELYGVTKGTEAWRAGMLRLLENRYLYSTVEFNADIDAIACTIGDIIYIQSSIPDWGVGGRVVSATANTVVLDQIVDLAAGAKKILVRTYDSVLEQEQINEEVVDTIVGTTVTIIGTWAVTPSQYDVYAIGLTTEVTKKYRVVGLKKSVDQEVTITAIEYNELAYGSDALDPVVPVLNYSEPGSSSYSIIKPPSVESITNIYPLETMFAESPLTADIPLFNGFGWTDDSPSAGSVTTSAFSLYYKGVAYAIAQFTSSNTYFYWDSTYDPGSGAGTVLQATNTLATAIGTNKWVVGINSVAAGPVSTFYPAFGRKVIHGGIIQADTIGANHLQVNSVDATKINVSDLSAISANLGTISVDTANIANAAIQNAQIDDLAVNTSNISANGVTQRAYAYTSGSVNLPDTHAYTTIQSVALTPVGGAVEIEVQFILYDGGVLQPPVNLKMYRGATEIYENGEFSMSYVPDTSQATYRKDSFIIKFIDTSPGTSAVTYYVKMSNVGLGTTMAASARRLTLTEYKK